MLAASVAATALGVYLLSSSRMLNTYFYDYFSLTVPFMSLAAFQLIVDAPRLFRLARLAPLTFGVYLIHPVFLDLRSARAAARRPRHGLDAALLTAAVFALSAASSWLLRRHPATRRLV